jgi:RHH-type rel operon transcriptional repressor/antitoxin RelB
VIIAKLTVQMLYNSKSFVREVAIMTTENYNIRLEQDLKDRAFAVIESFGLSPAQAIRLFLKQTAETNIIPLTFDYQVRASKSTLKGLLHGKHTGLIFSAETCEKLDVRGHLIRISKKRN